MTFPVRQGCTDVVFSLLEVSRHRAGVRDIPLTLRLCPGSRGAPKVKVLLLLLWKASRSPGLSWPGAHPPLSSVSSAMGCPTPPQKRPMLCFQTESLAS